MKINNISITPVAPDRGLVAFASVTLDDGILLNSIAIYRKLDGGLRLLYPSKRVKDSEMTVFHPINKETSRAIEDAIFKEYKNVFRKGCDDDGYDPFVLRY